MERVNLYLILIVLFFCDKTSAQSDSAEANMTSKIFYITVVDTNKSVVSTSKTTSYKEVYIDTLSKNYLVFERAYTDYNNPLVSRKVEKIPLDDILVLGYKTGTKKKEGVIGGAASFFIAGIILGNAAKNEDEYFGDAHKTNPFLTGLIAMVVGAGTGYLVGGYLDKYDEFELPDDKEKKYSEIKKIITTGIKYNK